jgi:restriction endonuclease in pPIWI_RE module
MVMAAAAMAANALTDTDQEPEGRVRTLMDGHGRILAARGPGNPLPFGVFRELLRGDLARLLPDGVPAEEMDGVQLITADGQFDDDLFDLEQEQRDVLRALAKTTRDGQSTSTALMEDEMDQDRVYSALKKRMSQDDYTHGRSSLIRTPAGSDAVLRRLNLPSSVAEFYRPISFAATYDRWWYPCPACRWPMKITVRGAGRRTRTGNARCFHRPHVAQGADYGFKLPELGRPPSLMPAPPPARPSGTATVLHPDTTGHVPEPFPVEGHKALTRGVWRWTTVPGLVEIALFDALTQRGLAPVLWPDLDAYDLYIAVGEGAARTEFRIDIKDYTSSILLAKKVQADGGDVGGADWLAVPDYRASSVPMLSGVCKQFDLKVATAGDLGALVCQAAGAAWA